LTRLIEAATEKALPLIIISTAAALACMRGWFSLMQMARRAQPWAITAKANCPTSVCSTHPTHRKRDGKLSSMAI